MTQAELELLVAAFRAEVEDLISSVNRRFYLNDGSVYPDEARVETPGVPWADQAEVLSVIPVGSRTDYLTVNIAGVEYWFISGVLVEKIGSITVLDKSITLAKMADVATSTVFYRKSAGTGSPEVQTLATLREDLNIPLAADLSNYVQKAAGYSLVLNTLISQIHAAGSDNQDLSLYQLKSDSVDAPTKPDIVTIHLPVASTVAGRCAAAVEGVDYPTGWVISAATYAKDMWIRHLRDKHIVDVTIWETNIPPYPELHQTRKLLSTAAYSGLICASKNEIIIETLATKQVELLIHITFSNHVNA